MGIVIVDLDGMGDRESEKRGVFEFNVYFGDECDVGMGMWVVESGSCIVESVVGVSIVSVISAAERLINSKMSTQLLQTRS